MIFPTALKEGDNIGIVSPASPLSRLDVQNLNYNVSLLKNSGFVPILSKNIYLQNGFFAGNDKLRAVDMMNMFLNKNIKAIICTRGDYGIERIIKYLNIQLIKSNPKFFIGYSNISAILNYFTDKLNIVTYHGPMLKKKLNELNLNSLLNTLKNPQKRYNISEFKNFNISMINSTNFEWLKNYPIAGGNLITLASTIGTPYEIETNNKVLFFEDIDEPSYKIDRALTQLKNAEKLENCAGFLIGDFTNCEDSFNMSWQKAILNILVPLKKPILIGLPFGHGENNITLTIGVPLLQTQ